MTVQPTLALAQFVAGNSFLPLPDRVRHEAKRALLNWVGCSVGAANHPTVIRALAALSPFCGPPQATVLGRRDRLDILHAALMNGITSHTFDFDDTHLKTVIHPSGPVAAAIVALAEYLPVTGEQLLQAFVLGVEVECRIGNAVYPSHYDLGWHITGTTGVFGAAAAAGKLLGLSETQLVWALGIAATQSSGLREMFGSMSKPLHPGMAAKNGLYAALLARSDFTSASEGIEGRRGFANVLSNARDYSKITVGLGETWELLENTYKPFACGIVIHPIIDGCIQLRDQHGLVGEAIASVDLRVHPLVLELTGKTKPQVGLEGKFSVFHSAAVALLDGAAGEAQYSDRRVQDAEVVSLRDRVRAIIDPALKEDAAYVSVNLRDGRLLEKHVEHAIGSLARPMSDADLEAKFRGLCAAVLAAEQIEALISQCWRFDAMTDSGLLAKMTVPANQ
ncbi:MAG: MmgE/PrpD family protein [Burkholderiales bacterium]|nr:MmgE/PrpD family protein [Burkholderiales bacterium]